MDKFFNICMISLILYIHPLLYFSALKEGILNIIGNTYFTNLLNKKGNFWK